MKIFQEVVLLCVLGENIPVVQTSVNGLIAGVERTLADLFDLTGE